MKTDKARDIARGVLPSTRRKGARDAKRNFHTKHRAAQRQVNHKIHRSLATVSDRGTVVHDPELFDDFEDLDTFDGYHAATVRPEMGWDGWDEILYHRRNGDKLGPLISWARATEKAKMDGWDVVDKIAYFKAVLPDTLQGRHALGHVEQALDLTTDEFRYGFYKRPTPRTFEDFRNAVTKCLSTAKGRRNLRDFIHETVPVAGHATTTNNGHFRREQARDENGALRYHPQSPEEKALGVFIPVMVDVWGPQIVSVTCDDCSFLRNDPLATSEAIKRFADIVWARRPRSGTYAWQDRRYDYAHHPFLGKIRDHIFAQR